MIMTDNVFYQMLSPQGRAIWDSLEDATAWEFGSHSEYTLVHKASRITLWIGNGRFFLDGYETFYSLAIPAPKPSIGLFERHILWFKVSSVMKTLKKKVKNDSAVIKALRGSNEI